MPGSLSTSTAIVWRSMLLAAPLMAGFPARLLATSHQHHALFGDRLLRLVLGAEQHLVVRRARGDHREAVLELVDAAIDDHRLVNGEHLLDHVVDLRDLAGAQADRAERLGEPHE